jgi:hypothetical protein
VFYAYFEEIPNVKQIEGIDKKALQKWAENEFKGKTLKIHKREDYKIEIKESYRKNEIYILPGKILVDIDGTSACALYSGESEAQAMSLIDSIRNLKKKRKAPYIHIIISGAMGVELHKLKCKKTNFKLSENYNDDLAALDKKIIESLNEKGEGGLFLFHGLPGTGKTFYIRHLVNRIKRKVIFLPIQSAESIDSPGLVNLLVDNPNSVLVVEDAERLLASRESAVNIGISTLLNISDGLLSDSLGIKIICTFNTHLSNIDNVWFPQLLVQENAKVKM